MRRWLSVSLALLALGACGAPPVAAQTAAEPVGPVDIGHGRQLFLQCQGQGSPPVFVIPGKGSYAEVWNVVIPPDDPIRASRFDLIEQARFVAGPDAVQPTVARTTRICAYDRPDTRPDGVDRSTPVHQPHTVAQDVEDLVALLGAAGLDGPFVFAAHSYGGLILDLLARTHPQLVAGIVMVDGVSEYLMTLGSPAQNAAFERDSAAPPEPGGEGVLMSDAFARIRDAPPLPRVPSIVLSADKFPAPAAVTPENYTLAQIHAANDLLAAELGTANVVATGSGHNLMLYQPKFVSDNIIDVVERVRSGG
ncbi:alpha/beta fold hydrolase [Mycolicibacterium flavescens]|uniref:alpha/beta fold hydrolase n=1 Tax=Mycolicibacterium flavescens TaxID=1776 RepID=UPI000AA9AD31|nr:alpha/beta hydrolase [Mycolicibacterium flavescens]